MKIPNCPCCNGEAKVRTFYSYPSNCFYIQCSSCGIRTDDFTYDNSPSIEEPFKRGLAIWSRRPN